MNHMNNVSSRSETGSGFLIPDLRFGHVTALYDACTSSPKKNQLDTLYRWFDDLFIEVRKGNERVDADFDDQHLRILANRVSGRLYIGDSDRVTQLAGRLYGTAKGNREKERYAAELVQKHCARVLVKEENVLIRLQERTLAAVNAMNETRRNLFHASLLDSMFHLALQREAMTDIARDEEPFPMQDEVFDGLLYCIGYQLHLEQCEHTANAFLWFLLGGLLRNEAGRLLRIYDSSFVPVMRQASETASLCDKLNYLFHPEQYYEVYEGDDLDRRFPGICWRCDQCGDHLDEQPGFDDHLPLWQCRRCGTVNRIELDEIYENEEAWRNHTRKESEERFNDAIARRRRQLQKPRRKRR